MRAAFDTNVLLDAIAERGYFADAQALILAVAQERLEGVISANSITDIYYILRKRIGDQKAREAIWNLMTVFDVADVDGECCATALGSPMKDFEDAVLAVSAARSGAETLVTGDRELLEETNCPLRTVTVQELLKELA